MLQKEDMKNVNWLRTEFTHGFSLVTEINFLIPYEQQVSCTGEYTSTTWDSSMYQRESYFLTS
jgi:hypothetical protein